MSFVTRDTWVGLVMLLVAAVYWHEADKIPISPLDGTVGAAGLPKTLAYALGVLALIMIVRSVIGEALGGKASAAPNGARGSLSDAMRPHLRTIGMLALGVGYLLLVSWLGYAIAIACLLLAVSLYVGAAISLRTVLFAMIGGVVCHLLFVEFLGIPLPAGEILGPLLGAG